MLKLNDLNFRLRDYQHEYICYQVNDVSWSPTVHFFFRCRTALRYYRTWAEECAQGKGEGYGSIHSNCSVHRSSDARQFKSLVDLCQLFYSLQLLSTSNYIFWTNCRIHMFHKFIDFVVQFLHRYVSDWQCNIFHRKLW